MTVKAAISAPFTLETYTETPTIEVPSWAKSAYISLPQLTSCTFTVKTSFDNGTTWGKRDKDLDGIDNPRTTYTGGSSTVRSIIWIDVKGSTLIKLVSTVGQQNIVGQVMFKG